MQRTAVQLIPCRLDCKVQVLDVEKIKQACSWLVAQIKTGIDWIRLSWPAIQDQAKKLACWANAVVINHVRKVMAPFNRGVVIAIETAE